MVDKNKLLIILDLNGTLLSKLNGSEKKIFFHHPNRDINEQNIGIYGNLIVLRPYFHYFIDLLFRHANVAIWTSALPKNSIPIVGHCFSGFLNRENFTRDYGPIISNPDVPITDGFYNLSFLWSQDKCDQSTKINPETKKPNFKPEFKKRLKKVWSIFPDYNSSNTIIIDDSLEKIKPDEVKNSIIINSFNVIDHAADYTKDEELLNLGMFFQDHIFANHGDPSSKDIRKITNLYKKIKDYKHRPTN